MSGARVIFTLPIFGGIPISETVTNSWLVMAFLMIGSLLLTRNLQKKPKGKQVLLEKGVETLYSLVGTTMGSDKLAFAPYIGTLFLFSLCSNMMGLLTLRAPTADLNTTAAWAFILFCCNQYFGVRSHGLWGRVKGFAEPIPVILPLNIIGEFSTPISVAFRHFGNMAAGLVITTLVYGALGGLTEMVFGSAQIPILALGLPAILSIYFDLFTGVMQAFIISMLTMVFIAMAID